MMDPKDLRNLNWVIFSTDKTIKSEYCILGFDDKYIHYLIKSAYKFDKTYKWKCCPLWFCCDYVISLIALDMRKYIFHTGEDPDCRIMEVIGNTSILTDYDKIDRINPEYFTKPILRTLKECKKYGQYKLGEFIIEYLNGKI